MNIKEDDYCCKIAVYEHKGGKELLKIATTNSDCDTIIACIKSILISSFQMLNDYEIKQSLYVEMNIECDSNKFISINSDDETFDRMINDIRNLIIKSKK
ncbi:hypothetical protein ACTQ2N_11030 [Ruminococcus sp. LCP21S3_E8]